MSQLDDPDYARFAWKRFRRLLAWMALAGLIASVVSVWLVGEAYGALGWVAMVAMVGGVTGSVLMAGALMGLAFLSSGTGHDEAIEPRKLDQSASRRD